MSTIRVIHVSPQGDLVIPANVRQSAGIAAGVAVTVEAKEGLLVVRPVEEYTEERKAEFLLNNAVDAVDYAAACEAVRNLGLDPAVIPHSPPPGA